MRFKVPVLALAFGMAALAATGPARAAAPAKQQLAKHKITQLKSYTELEPIYATIIFDGRPIGLLLVAVGLNTPDAGLRAQVTRAMPLLRDAYLRNMMQFAATAVRPWKQPDVNVISARLQRVTDRVMHKKGAQVLLTEVAIRITR